VTGADEARFLALVTADPTVRAVLDRAPALGPGEWWLTDGVLFQTVWNALTGRPSGTGIRDADLLSFDPDTSWSKEDAVIRAGAGLFADLPVPVKIRNEARVHLWYESGFGVPAPPFRDCADAIDHVAAVCCCYGITVDAAGRLRVCAPEKDPVLLIPRKLGTSLGTGPEQGRTLAGAVARAHGAALGRPAAGPREHNRARPG
jgi:hypothetical protein